MITGIGLVVPQAIVDALSGAHPDAEHPEITGFELPEGACTAGYEVLDFNQETELPNIKSFIDKTSAFALVAGKRALADAGLDDREKRPAGLEIGCAYGTMMGCLDAMGIYWTKVKTSNPKFAQPLTFTHGYANSPSSLLCIENALKGPAATFSGERTSGEQALVFAYDQIVSGSGEAMLVCASESLTQAAWNHFRAVGDITDDVKTSMIPVEGGVALLLESAERAQARGAKILAEIDSVTVAAKLSPGTAAGGVDFLGASALFGIAHLTKNVMSAGGLPEHIPMTGMRTTSERFSVENMSGRRSEFCIYLKKS